MVTGGAPANGLNGASQGLLLAHNDGWLNALTKFGTAADSTMHTRYRAEHFGQQQLAQMRLDDDLMSSYVEKPAKAMLRRGFTVHTDSAKLDAYVEKRFEEVEAKQKLQRLVEYRRTYGGGGGALGYDDGVDPALPVRRGARLLWIHGYDTSELRAEGLEWDRNPMSANFGQPTLWTANLPMALGTQSIVVSGANSMPQFGSRLKIHPSRVIPFVGSTASNMDRIRLLGWGVSGLSRFAQKVADLDGAFRSLLNHLKDMSQPVLGMANLSALLANKEQSGRVLDRAIAVNLSRSAAGMVIRDSEKETYERISASIAGFAEAIDRLMLRTSCAAGMPNSVLFGRAPTGLGGDAAGASDVRNWYDELEGDQAEQLLPHVLRLARGFCDEVSGGRYTGDVHVEFESLWQPTAAEEADLRLKTGQTDKLYVDMGVPLPFILRSRFGGKKYSTETQIPEEWLALQEKATILRALKPPPAPPVQQALPPAPGAPTPPQTVSGKPAIPSQPPAGAAPPKPMQVAA